MKSADWHSRIEELESLLLDDILLDEDSLQVIGEAVRGYTHAVDAVQYIFSKGFNEGIRTSLSILRRS